jgi:hypothetical protein
MTAASPAPEMDREWIIRKLRDTLALYENEISLDQSWHAILRVTYQRVDGSGAGVTFVVGTEPATPEEDA